MRPGLPYSQRLVQMEREYEQWRQQFGMAGYGMLWHAEMEAQKRILARAIAPQQHQQFHEREATNVSAVRSEAMGVGHAFQSPGRLQERQTSPQPTLHAADMGSPESSQTEIASDEEDTTKGKQKVVRAKQRGIKGKDSKAKARGRM